MEKCDDCEQHVICCRRTAVVNKTPERREVERGLLERLKTWFLGAPARQQLNRPAAQVALVGSAGSTETVEPKAWPAPDHSRLDSVSRIPGHPVADLSSRREAVVDAALEDRLSYQQLRAVLDRWDLYGFTGDEVELLEYCLSQKRPGVVIIPPQRAD